MILDDRLEFFDGAAIPTSAGTAALGDVVDTLALGGSAASGLSSAGRDIGMGRDLWWYASVDVAGAGGTSVQLQLVSSASSTLSTPTVHAQTAVVPLASLTAGKLLAMMAVPAEAASPYLRYLGIIAVVAGTFSGGNISSGLMLDPKGWKAYPDAIN